MNKKDKAKLHTRLKLVKKCVDTDPSKLNHYSGICYNSSNIKKPYFKVCMRDLFEKYPYCALWENGDKNLTYPVDGEIEFTHSSRTKAIWANPRRIALLDWLIEETKP